MKLKNMIRFYKGNKTLKRMKINILSLVFFLSSLLILEVFGQSSTCHYTCASCSGSEYFNCLTCPGNRGL